MKTRNHAWIIVTAVCLATSTKVRSSALLERKLIFRGVTREYFLQLPENFQREKSYWLLVSVHGGSGGARSNPKILSLRKTVRRHNFPAITVSPAFNTVDKQVSRFPALGEGEFLKAVIDEIRKNYNVHSKILLTGYSMGGQFAHRFAFANPDLVQACAPFAAGTWSTPDGKLLIEGYGIVSDPKQFLSDPLNARLVPMRLKDLFDSRTVDIVGLPARKGAEKVPFLVMCGSLDTRFPIAKQFAKSLKDTGFTVETEWPKTPHASKAEKYKSEFNKYPEHVMAFFMKHTTGIY